MRFLLLALAFAGAMAGPGCSDSRLGPAPRVPRSLVRKQSVGTVPTLAGAPQCVYYTDSDSGDLMRVSIDGTIRELVIRCGDERFPHKLAVTRPSAKAQGRIHLAGVPGGSGFTVVDVAAARATMPGFDARSGPGPLYYANSDGRSPWNIAFKLGHFEIEPHHAHDYWDSVTFTCGASNVSYDFENVSEENEDILGLADDWHVVIFDEPNIIVLNLASNERTCIANGAHPVLWPRNLHEKPRFAPIANWKDNAAVYEWKLRSPDDIHVMPEHLKRRRTGIP